MISTTFICPVVTHEVIPIHKTVIRQSIKKQDLVMTEPGFEEYVAWRDKRIKDLTANDGWLTLCGLFWLEEENKKYSIGSGESAYCKFPDGKTPNVR